MPLAIQTMQAEVVKVITETPETRTFRFDLGDAQFSFKPGQFVMITADIPGKGPITRPYSIASSPLDPMLDLTIKKFPAGAMSSHFCDTVAVGDTFTLKGPYGLFTLDETAPEVVFIAAGSGIAPFRSMWRYVQQKKLSLPITLLYSSKTAEYIIYQNELAAIGSNGVQVVHTLTRNQDPAWPGYHRRIDRDMIREVISDLGGGKKFYACGPPPMCHAAADDLKALGVDPSLIKMEKFD